jgi:Kef-type K+ transport system membrane component KefB
MRADVGRLEGHGGFVLAAGAALAIVAVAAKLASGLGVVRRQADRLVVGVGMVPRGEVGLVFAAIGRWSGLLAGWQYTTLVVVVLITTFITPIWLRRLEPSFTGAPDAALAPSSNAEVLP